MYLTTAMLCLALNIYHEARGEPLVGQHAVAQVTMNRAERDPNKLCDVVFEPKQFSWTNKLLPAKGQARTAVVRRLTPKEGDAWNIARAIAFQTAMGNVQDFTKGAMYYHAVSVSPFWNKTYKLVAVIGQHRFYSEL